MRILRDLLIGMAAGVFLCAFLFGLGVISRVVWFFLMLGWNLL